MDCKIDNMNFAVRDLRIINQLVDDTEIRLATSFSYHPGKPDGGLHTNRHIIEIFKEDEADSSDRHFYIRFVVDTSFSSNAKKASKSLSTFAAKIAYPEIRARLDAVLALVGMPPISLPLQL